MEFTLTDLATRIGAEVNGDGSAVVRSVGTLEDAEPGQITFLSNAKYARLLSTTRATAVIAAPGVQSDRVTLLTARDPYYAFARAVVEIYGYRQHPHKGIHPKANVDPTARVGEGTVVYPGVYVGPRSVGGRDCSLYPNVVIYDECVVGDRVILHAGVSIGGDGYGFATHRGVHHKIPQVGNVVIEDDVEIGANCCIQRAAMGSTVIGAGTKFADLVSIGHGVQVGAHGLIVALSGIAGSTTVGHHAIIGGQVGIAGHIKIGNHVTFAARSGTSGDVPDGQVMYGAPGVPGPIGRRNFSLLTQIYKLLERIRALEQKAGTGKPED